MFISPLDDQNVIASLAHQVVDAVIVATGVLDEDFFAGSFGSVHADVQEVVTLTKSFKVNKNFTFIIF